MASSKLCFAAILLALTRPIQAHITLWHPSLYGWTSDPNQNDMVTPLQDLPFGDGTQAGGGWWFHARKDVPPADGQFLELPAGGKVDVELACNKALTSFGQNSAHQTGLYACDSTGTASGNGAMHTTDQLGSSNPTDLKGTALAIAYKSDPDSLQPEDFAVISTIRQSVWFKHVSYDIPSDLPACPPGGCHCSWFWVHAVDAGSQQIYHTVYRCNVTGATNTIPLPAALPPRKCPVEKSNCTVGPRQPIYWYQQERNNVFSYQYDPPFYNDDYGFTDGAQTDLYANVKSSTPSVASISSTDAATTTSTADAVSSTMGFASSSSAFVSSSAATSTLSLEAVVATAPATTSSSLTVSSSASPTTANATAMIFSPSSTTGTAKKCQRKRKVTRSTRGLRRLTRAIPVTLEWDKLTHQEKEVVWRRGMEAGAGAGRREIKSHVV